MNIKEVVKTEAAERRKAGAGLPLRMFAGLLVIALAFIALLYFLAPGGQGQNPGLMPTPVLGVVVSPDLTIAGVDGGSIAEGSGLKAGDKLQKVDGQSVKSLDETRSKMLDDLYNQKEITLTVLRNGQSQDITLKPAPPKSTPGGPTPTPLPGGYAYF